MTELVTKSLGELAQSGYIVLNSNGDVDSTSMGEIMSYSYLSQQDNSSSGDACKA